MKTSNINLSQFFSFALFYSLSITLCISHPLIRFAQLIVKEKKWKKDEKKRAENKNQV